MINSSRNKAEIGHVIIGECGLILIETKNYFGTIHIKSNDWISEIQGKEQWCENPVLQSKRHEVVVKNFLASIGLSYIPVYSVVAIANKQAIVLGEDIIPVLKSEALQPWIEGLPPMIVQEDIIKLGTVLKPYKVNKIPMVDNFNNKQFFSQSIIIGILFVMIILGGITLYHSKGESKTVVKDFFVQAKENINPAIYQNALDKKTK